MAACSLQGVALSGDGTRASMGCGPSNASGFVIASG